MNTPTRRRPQRPTLCATASVNPSCLRPSRARRLLRQANSRRPSGSRTASTPDTSPTCVSRSRDSNAHRASPVCSSFSLVSISSRPRPMQLVAMNAVSTSAVMSVWRRSLRVQRRAQRDRCELGRCQGFQKAGQDLEDHGQAPVRARRVAVVQQQDISSLEVMREPAEHHIGAAADGIEAPPCPARETQIEARQHRLEKWIAKAGRRAEESWPLAGRVADDVLRALDFVFESPGPEEREVVHMSLAVILDHVTAVHDLARELGVALDSLTDAEEARLDAMLIQQ